MLTCPISFADWNIVFMPYAIDYPNLWRDHRRVFDRQTNPEAAKRFRPQHVLAVNEMLRRILDCPPHYAEHVRHMAGRSIMSIAYGIDVLDKDDPYIRIGEIANDIVALTTTPGSYLVDTLSFCTSLYLRRLTRPDILCTVKYIPDWLPGAGFKRQAREWRTVADSMLNDPFNVTKRAMVNIMIFDADGSTDVYSRKLESQRSR